MKRIICEKTPIKRNNLITKLDHIEKEYRFIIEFRLLGVKDGLPNIIHFTTDGNSRSYGDRIPALYYDDDKNQLIIVSAINNCANFVVKAEDICIDVVHRVEISQELIGNKYFYSVVINDTQISRVINHNPRIFNNVHVFVSDPWFGSQTGYIQELTYVPRSCPEFVKPKGLMDSIIAEPIFPDEKMGYVTEPVFPNKKMGYVTDPVFLNKHIGYVEPLPYEQMVYLAEPVFPKKQKDYVAEPVFPNEKMSYDKNKERKKAINRFWVVHYKNADNNVFIPTDDILSHFNTLHPKSAMTRSPFLDLSDGVVKQQNLIRQKRKRKFGKSGFIVTPSSESSMNFHKNVWSIDSLVNKSKPLKPRKLSRSEKKGMYKEMSRSRRREMSLKVDAFVESNYVKDSDTKTPFDSLYYCCLALVNPFPKNKILFCTYVSSNSDSNNKNGFLFYNEVDGTKVRRKFCYARPCSSDSIYFHQEIWPVFEEMISNVVVAAEKEDRTLTMCP